MNYAVYIKPFLLALFISACVSVLLVFVSDLRFLSDKRRSIKRLGGLALILAFCLTLILDQNLYLSSLLWGILGVCLFIGIVGVLDDFLDLHWKYQLLFQIIVATVVYIFGARIEYVTNPFGGVIHLDNFPIFSFALVLVWIILLMNVTNWLDGIDGLSGGVSLIAAVTIFFLSLKPEVNQPPVGIITMALAGSLAGFLILNFHPSRILAGSSGSFFMGFILAVISIFAGAKIATALLVMFIPILDALWVIGERIKSGASVFRGDKRHLHFKLQQLGWSIKKITLLFYLATLIISFVALNTRAVGKLTAIVLILIMMIIFLLFVNKKIIHEKSHS